MLAFIVQRLFQAIIVMFVVGLISFSLFQYVGDPINNMVGQDSTALTTGWGRAHTPLNEAVRMAKRLFTHANKA